MSKIIVYPYTTYKQINQFSIGYMINPSLHVNRVFREKIEKSLRATFHENTMENIRDVIQKKDICNITQIMFYGVKGGESIKLYRVLSCVLYYII